MVDIGSSVSGQLSHLGVTDAHPWYFKHFTNYPAGTAPYCDVLERPEGFPAWDELQRICTKKGKPKTDPAWCAVSRDWTQVGPYVTSIPELYMRHGLTPYTNV
jgi:hypothetical protein